MRSSDARRFEADHVPVAVEHFADLASGEVTPLTTAEERIANAVNIASQYGPDEGSHHKDWVIDQMCRALLGTGYNAWRSLRRPYWSEGIAP